MQLYNMRLASHDGTKKNEFK